MGQSQIRDQIPYLRLREQVRVTTHTEGHTRGAQCERNHAGLSIGAKEHRGFTGMIDLAGREQGLDLLCDESGLVLFVAGNVHARLRSPGIARERLTPYLERRRERIAQGDDHSGRTIILVEREDLRLGVLLRED
jgi:hypothetical protein